MKKILLSLAMVIAVGALVAGGTIAFYADTETSTNNIFTAGSIDLTVDHTLQTYNDVNCKTCSVVLVSDTTNKIVEKNGDLVTSYDAELLSWIHPAWTAQNDPTLAAAGAQWIWEADPVKQADTVTDVEYTFRKTFEWWGPVSGSDLFLAVGSDNSVEVWLNGVKIGENTGEYGYREGSMLHILAVDITSNLNQGNNILEFKVTNWGQLNGTVQSNPAGLIYKFSIDGQCGDDFFRKSCQLWGQTDITNEQFYNFDDVKPGDRGVNVISLHVDTNDAYACLITHNIKDLENDVVDPEIEAGDSGAPEGELSNYLRIFAWNDLDQDGVYEPFDGEIELLPANTPIDSEVVQMSLLGGGPTVFVGTAWCAGTQTVDLDGTINCSGAGMGNDAQSDSLSASLTAYAEQQRNNPDFSCFEVRLDEED